MFQMLFGFVLGMVAGIFVQSKNKSASTKISKVCLAIKNKCVLIWAKITNK